MNVYFEAQSTDMPLFTTSNLHSPHPPSITPTTPPAHTPKRPYRRKHLQPLNVRVPFDRLNPPPNYQPQTRIANNHEPKRHGNQPIQRTQAFRRLEHDLDAGSVDNECGERGASQDAVEGRAVREHVLAKRQSEARFAGKEVEHLHGHYGPVVYCHQMN